MLVMNDITQSCIQNESITYVDRNYHTSCIKFLFTNYYRLEFLFHNQVILHQIYVPIFTIKNLSI